MKRRLQLQGVLPDDGLRTLAVMHGPDDEPFRRSFFATSYVRGYDWDRPGPPVEMPRDLIAALLEAPAYDRLKQDTAERVKDGTVAGYVMLCLFMMWKYPQVHGARSAGGSSIKKAIHFCRYLSTEFKWKYGDGSLLPSGETKIKECWADYRSVSHFWAAFAWNTAFPVADRMSLFREDLGKFLSAARWFQEFGTMPLLDNKALKRKESVLGNDFWHVGEEIPATLLLPDDPSVLENSPLTKALRAYAAK